MMPRYAQVPATAARVAVSFRADGEPSVVGCCWPPAGEAAVGGAATAAGAATGGAATGGTATGGAATAGGGAATAGGAVPAACVVGRGSSRSG
eukprot:4082061-Prymnesium_polylepis.1